MCVTVVLYVFNCHHFLFFFFFFFSSRRRHTRCLSDWSSDVCSSDLGIGSTPGTMNVMGMYGASKLDTVSKVQLRSSGAVVAGGEPGKFVPPYAIRTIFDEFSLDAPILRMGNIRFVPALSGLERSEFMPPVGVVEGSYTTHSVFAARPEEVA